jgi:hypothetical protein
MLHYQHSFVCGVKGAVSSSNHCQGIGYVQKLCGFHKSVLRNARILQRGHYHTLQNSYSLTIHDQFSIYFATKKHWNTADKIT